MERAQDARTQQEPLAALISRYWLAELFTKATRQIADAPTKLQPKVVQSILPHSTGCGTVAGL